MNTHLCEAIVRQGVTLRKRRFAVVAPELERDSVLLRDYLTNDENMVMWSWLANP